MAKKQQKILVVEDELFIGIEIESILVSEGYGVIGPVGNITEALAAIEKFSNADSKPVGAFLDANLNGRPVDEVAEALALHAVPTVFLSGYGRSHLPEKFRDLELIGKPFETHALIEAASRFTSAA